MVWRRALAFSTFLIASRNPAAINQHSIINEFKGYKKYYFIGGSTSWANVRGVLTSAIDGIDIYEEGRLKSPVEDVWGASDKNLFLEANELIRAHTQSSPQQPFFAYIQTSSNHRPYTIPEEDLKMFAPPKPSEKELEAQVGAVPRAAHRAPEDQPAALDASTQPSPRGDCPCAALWGFT